jgi:hypothetical protein
MLTIKLSTGLTLTTDRANSTAAMIFRQAFGIPLEGLTTPEASQALALEVFNKIGTPGFDEQVARAIVQVFPGIPDDLCWYQDPTKKPASSIIGLELQDILTIAVEVVTAGTAKLQKTAPKKPASPLREAARLPDNQGGSGEIAAGFVARSAAEREMDELLEVRFEEQAGSVAVEMSPEEMQQFQEFKEWQMAQLP